MGGALFPPFPFFNLVHSFSTEHKTCKGEYWFKLS
jgi:hypothetical protein